MKQKFFPKPVVGVWCGGIIFSVFLIMITGGSAGSVFLRLIFNLLLVTLAVCGGWFIWNRFLIDKETSTASLDENDEEDEILLESDSKRLYTGEGGEGYEKMPSQDGEQGDAFSRYQYDSDMGESDIHHLDSRNPYAMSDSLLRKFKAEEEDALAKFKAAFHSPEEIAKAVRTELHKDD